ncbi:hypothetical protein GCM10018980_73810 [Streptomyces capoamus]|uniref:Uncharacterized protein n=1 Tax=Streptomyces capoamus TaxID=68183 RepID=A0A919KG29_9ACTN|nr:hypothetical protein GCM10018980_73810 [Streptomyces capoamus]
MTTEPIPIGWVPENGNSHADTATTADGASPSAHAPGRRFCRNSAAATRPTNSPATGEAMVASAASGAAARAFAQRLYRHRYGQQNTAATAPSANIVPSPKVTRPEIALARNAATPPSEAHSGLRTARLRIRTSVSSAADTVPAIIIVVRTPRTDIRYGDTTLYDTGCMPPYQARLYAESGCRPTNSAHASCAARSPPLFAKVKNQMMCSTPASIVTDSTGCRSIRCLRGSSAASVRARAPGRTSGVRLSASGADPRIREPAPGSGSALSARVGSAVAT